MINDNEYGNIHFQCLNLNKGCCGRVLEVYSIYSMSLAPDMVAIDPALLSYEDPRPFPLAPPPPVGSTSSSASLSDAAST